MFTGNEGRGSVVLLRSNLNVVMFETTTFKSGTSLHNKEQNLTFKWSSAKAQFLIHMYKKKKKEFCGTKMSQDLHV